MHLFGDCSESIRFWVTLVQFWPSGGQKMIENGSKWWFPTIIWKSIHPIQFKLVLYTCWVNVQNWFAFGPCWPNFGPLVVTKWWFPTIIWKSIHAIQFTLAVYTYWVSVQNSLLARWPNFGPLVAQNYWKWWFPTIIWKSIHAIQFNLGAYTYWVSVQNRFALGHIGQILAL